jgi:putative toxin-antitoxin system antitoxin component (TIGR02293 family)
MALMDASEITQILGDQHIPSLQMNTYFDMIALGDQGLTKNALTNLAHFLNLSMSQIAQILSISERTIQRYSASHKLSSGISEHVLHITEVVSKGMDVFEKRERFLAWLNHPNTALANKTPLNLLKSRFGIDILLKELGKLEHGVFA